MLQRGLLVGAIFIAALVVAACGGSGGGASRSDATIAGAVATVGAGSAAPPGRTDAQAEATSRIDAGGASPVQAGVPAIDCANLVVTPAQTEGPYFKSGSPERTSLIEPGTTGTRLTLTGYVVDTNCRPVAGALLDFWQADGSGAYDNSGYTLRGHQYTDENGRFELETVVPGPYPGRTRHIHVKVQAPGGSVLTTQLYFPDEPGNGRDGIFRPETVLQNVQQAPNGSMIATFTFVLDTN